MSIHRLFKSYEDIEKRYEVFESKEKYSDLVTADSDGDFPVHRWFHLKESFSKDLLTSLTREWKVESGYTKKILDPFCGIGTSLISAQILNKRKDLNSRYLGFEINPFLKFVSEVKSKWHLYDDKKFINLCEKVVSCGDIKTEIDPPKLSTVKREDVYSKETLEELLKYRSLIDGIECREKDLLKLGYASIVEEVSGARKDGRALRIVGNDNKPGPKRALKESYKNIYEDIRRSGDLLSPVESDIILGDGRKTNGGLGNLNTHKDEFGLIAYSPPYPNNIDYSEVYKLELWMCGFVEDSDEFLNLRHQTFRSHPSVRFKNPIDIVNEDSMLPVRDVLDTLIGALPRDGNRDWRADLFRGYFDDMHKSLRRQRNLLTEGGWIFCVVGNSIHGPRGRPEARVTIAADLIIALIAESLGLEVQAIQIARHLTRRSPANRFLRESIVVMRK